ncbi:hypothetical protein PIROE2DRAFT_15579 [Piromyces sp. E2]|nr:hypothetical protein PIROE2DRAFT_15579 [Piromyces sp. E2]|eukprot:OUM59011.1 hypothetical protein PIROE2DRAFT_15579 [Piromyces sp. E2]
MNFKTIFTIFALAFACSVKASPIIQCSDSNALFLEWNSTYSCLLPVSKFYSSESEHCIKVFNDRNLDGNSQGNVFCVVQEETSIPTCIRSKNSYNSNYCNYYLKAMADFKGMDIKSI